MISVGEVFYFLCRCPGVTANLLVDFVDHGHIDAQWQGHDAIMAAHDYRAKALSELPITAQSLMKGEPVIPTETQVL